MVATARISQGLLFVALSCSLVCCGAPGAKAASWSTDGPALGDSPTALALIEALQARHRAPKTVTFTQRAVPYDKSGPQAAQTMNEWLRIPGWLRIDLADPEPTSVVFHPQGRTMITASGRRDGDTGSTVMLLMLDVFAQDPDSWLAKAEAVGLNGAVVSLQEWDGDEAWVLGAEPGQADRTQLWLDAESLLPLRYLEVQPGQGGQTVVLEGRASQYKDFDGVPFHTYFEFFQGGELRLVEVYEDVVIDGEIPDEMFDLEVIAAQLAEGADEVGAAPASRQLLPPGVLIPADADMTPLSPHVAVGLSGEVAVSYAVGDEIWVSVSPDGGERFAEPVRVGGRGLLGKGPSRGPRIAVNDKAMVVVGLHGKQLMGQDGDLLAWRSTDKGVTWAGPVQINDMKDATKEGLSAIAAAPDGRLLCVWLDLRMGATELWGAWSLDGGASWGENVPLYRSPDGSICPCCHPTVDFDPQTGDALIMWRNAIAGERDMYVARMVDGVVGEATRLGNDGWKLNNCPMAGGGLDVTTDGKVLTAWRRRHDLYRASPGKGELRLGSGQLVRVASGPQGASYIWQEKGILHATVASKELQLGEGNHPWLASAPDGLGPVVAVWVLASEGPERVVCRVLQAR